MEAASEVIEKKPRKRMKSLYNNIRDQVEFYFSDSNLHRDRFMKKVIAESEDGYIDIELFLNFNKIKDLTTDVDSLRKALRSSNKLQISEDGRKVKRSKPLSEPKQIDERTIYVECLPHHVDHMWVKRMFSTCGEVLYVSIPRYKTTGDPKGFAFVEFDTVEAAKKACEELNNPPVEADGQPGKFPKTRKQLLQLQRKLGCKGEETEGLEALPCESKDNKDSKPGESPTKLSKRQRRRRRQTSESSVDGTELSPMKRRKTVSIESDNKPKTETNAEVVVDKGSEISDKAKPVEESNVSACGEQSEKEDNGKLKKAEKKKIRTQSDASASSADSEVDVPANVDGGESEATTVKVSESRDSLKSEVRKRKAEGESSTDEVKKRKLEETVVTGNGKCAKKITPSKKRKRKKKKQRGKDVPELRVISKKEWMDLRTEYLSLQKKSMTNLKQTLSRIRRADPSGQTVTSQKPAIKENPVKEVQPVSQTKSKVEYVPDVIVKIKSPHPFTRKQIKEYFGEEGGVAYVDLIEGDCSGYIRFHDSESAKKAANAQPKSYTFYLLQGEDESEYWNKLQSDREAKLSNKNKPKKRGTQKLADKVQKINKENVQRKHIIFDD